MDTLDQELVCPVCGWLLETPAWKGDLPSDEICPCCGIQFGYHDAIGFPQRAEIYGAWRQRWVEGGMKWHSIAFEAPPEDWDPIEQLQRVQDHR